MSRDGKNRPSVSMRRPVFLRMAYAADTQDHIARCAWVELAIVEKLDPRDRSRPPPEGWEPEDRRGRPKKTETEARDHFTF